MKKLFSLPFFLVGIGFVLGMFLFFPIDRLKYPIQDKLSQALRLDLEMGELNLGTGLGLGLSRGGVFAIHIKNMSLTIGPAQSINCSNASISPKILAIFLARASMAFMCELKSGSYLMGSFSASPFWKPSAANVEILATNIPLDSLSSFLKLSGLTGELSGTVLVNNIDLQKAPGSPQVEWNIQTKNLVSPPLNSDFIRLPSIPFGSINSTGSFHSGSLKVNQLNIGTPGSPLEGQIKIDFGLNQLGVPVSGELSGRLKTQELLENQLKGAISLDMILGKIKDNGYREFKRTIEGSIASLLAPAPLDN